ncbi:MAG: hypothetical protein EP324_00785 [Gammaproteobacteria bacterium]|nr:MAG: hypothetical protein EP324_00785 [Gammaproteobacteria bacterium]
MVQAHLPFDPELARLVRADILDPHQQPTQPNFKTACDFRQQVMLKHPFLSDFHSRAEHLHAGLLEGDPAVSSYIPQPFRLRVRQCHYTPDCYVVADNRPRQVIELKPHGEMKDELRVPLTAFFAQHGMTFVVLSNEAVLEREIEALNWLEIVTILNQAQLLLTETEEAHLLSQLHLDGPCTLGDIVDMGDREHSYRREIALFRLLHQGHLRAELNERPLDLDTGVALCT